MDRLRQWHRWFGASWRDFVHGQPVEVEVEVDLSLQQQFLDVVLIRATGGGPLTVEMPDGFEDFGPYNLISFKSFQETLDGEAMDELVGHYGAYRKQVSPSPSEKLPADQFRLYAVCSRFPRRLASGVTLMEVRDGVYEARSFSKTVRVIVLGMLPMTPPNAALLGFSADAERWGYARETYEPRSASGSTLLRELFEGYKLEGLPMPYTLEQQIRDSKKFILERASHEELLAIIPVEKRLEGISVERRLEGLSPEEEAEMLRLLLSKRPPGPPAP